MKKQFFLLLAVIGNISFINAAAISGTCGTNLSWKLNTSNGVVTISGTGPMTDYHPNYISGATYNPWRKRTDVKAIVIEEGVTSIGGYAFAECTSVKSVEIANSVKSINIEAFADCTSLEDVVIGSGIETNGIYSNYIFKNCPYLMRVTCKAEYPLVICEAVFSGCGVLGGIDLYVPIESVARYKKADVWSEFNIIGVDFNNQTPQYKITWQDDEGNILLEENVDEGTTPTYSGNTPSKQATTQNTYEFIGWLPTIKPATRNICYTTNFAAHSVTPERVYHVNIQSTNCSLNISNEYPQNAVITIETTSDECYQFTQWSDGNKDNPRTITVTEDATYTAELTKLNYTIKGQNASSAGGSVQVVNP